MLNTQMLDDTFSLILSNRKVTMVFSVAVMVGLAGYSVFELVKEIRGWNFDVPTRTDNVA